MFAAGSPSGWLHRLRDYLAGAGTVLEIIPPSRSGGLFHRDGLSTVMADFRSVSGDLQRAFRVVQPREIGADGAGNASEQPGPASFDRKRAESNGGHHSV